MHYPLPLSHKKCFNEHVPQLRQVNKKFMKFEV